MYHDDTPPPGSANGDGQPTPRRRQRTYSDDERTAAIMAVTLFEGNVERAARATGVPPNSLREWLSPDSPAGQRARARAEGSMGELAAEMQKIIWNAIDVVRDKLGDESAYRANLVACCLTDKVLLIRGAPTSINATVAATADRFDMTKLSADEQATFRQLTLKCGRGGTALRGLTNEQFDAALGLIAQEQAVPVALADAGLRPQLAAPGPVEHNGETHDTHRWADDGGTNHHHMEG